MNSGISHLSSLLKQSAHLHKTSQTLKEAQNCVEEQLDPIKEQLNTPLSEFCEKALTHTSAAIMEFGQEWEGAAFRSMFGTAMWGVLLRLPEELLTALGITPKDLDDCVITFGALKGGFVTKKDSEKTGLALSNSSWGPITDFFKDNPQMEWYEEEEWKAEKVTYAPLRQAFLSRLGRYTGKLEVTVTIEVPLNPLTAEENEKLQKNIIRDIEDSLHAVVDRASITITSKLTD